MRKIALFLALALSVTACTKSLDIARPEPQFDYFYSRVKHFTDGRKPVTDTVWTMRLSTVTLVDSFRVKDQYVYEVSNTYVDMGSFWSKVR